jgi:hypothetical protein
MINKLVASFFLILVILADSSFSQYHQGTAAFLMKANNLYVTTIDSSKLLDDFHLFSIGKWQGDLEKCDYPDVDGQVLLLMKNDSLYVAHMDYNGGMWVYDTLKLISAGGWQGDLEIYNQYLFLMKNDSLYNTSIYSKYSIPAFPYDKDTLKLLSDGGWRGDLEFNNGYLYLMKNDSLYGTPFDSLKIKDNLKLISAGGWQGDLEINNGHLYLMKDDSLWERRINGLTLLDTFHLITKGNFQTGDLEVSAFSLLPDSRVSIVGFGGLQDRKDYSYNRKYSESLDPGLPQNSRVDNTYLQQTLVDSVGTDSDAVTFRVKNINTTLSSLDKSMIGKVSIDSIFFKKAGTQIVNTNSFQFLSDKFDNSISWGDSRPYIIHFDTVQFNNKSFVILSIDNKYNCKASMDCYESWKYLKNYGLIYHKFYGTHAGRTTDNQTIIRSFKSDLSDTNFVDSLNRCLGLLPQKTSNHTEFRIKHESGSNVLLGSNRILIQFPGKMNKFTSKIEIFTLSGKRVYLNTVKSENGTISIPYTDFQNGMYIMLITNDKQLKSTCHFVVGN